jgi:hypothetical protein
MRWKLIQMAGTCSDCRYNGLYSEFIFFTTADSGGKILLLLPSHRPTNNM